MNEMVENTTEETTTDELVETNMSSDETTDEVLESKDDVVETDEVVVTIGEAPPQEEENTQAPAWVKDLRKSHRDIQKENRELREQLKATQTTTVIKVEAGVKPKLEDCDYDADRYEDELSKWYDRKKIIDDQNAKAKVEQEAVEKAWQDKLESYGKAKTSLKVQDYEEAESVAQEVLSKTQQGIILQGAENPALVVYALGKNPAKAKELASIKDPVKYAFAVAKLETQLKITQRKAPPPEGSIVKGTGSVSGAVDSTLERLRGEASKTGDYTKVMQYKRNKKT